MTKYLSSMLEIFLPVSKRRGFRKVVQSLIIEPAFQMAHNMHLSENQFSMNYTETYDNPGVCQLAVNQNPEVECVNITGRRVGFPTEDARVVEYMFDMAPELRWSIAKGDQIFVGWCVEPRPTDWGRDLSAVRMFASGH
jgi:hypothetical protein